VTSTSSKWVRDALGALAFDDAWTRGERMDRDATVALVVAELDAVEAELARND
jgi:hypothetical protein